MPKREEMLYLVNGLKTALYRTNMEAGEMQRAQQFRVPLRVYKNNLIKMKISYAAFLEDMDLKSYISFKFWKCALEKLEAIKETNGASGPKTQ